MIVDPAAAPLLRVAGRETRILGEADIPLLQALFESCNDFFQLINGRAVSPDEARAFVHRQLDHERWIVGLVEPGAPLLGLVELVAEVPKPGDWCVGLLLVGPSHRNAGLGAQIMAAVAAWVTARQGRRLTVVVQDANTGARRFWTRLGFQPYAQQAGEARYAADVARVAELAGA